MVMKNVEEIYVISPLQEAVLLNVISAEDLDLGSSCSQLSYELHGFLNIFAFEKAWQKLVNYHSILRTFFVWQRTEKPLQVVSNQLKFSLIHHDWQHLLPMQQQEQLNALLEAERVQGFDPSKTPLFRVILCCTAKDEYQLICTYSRLVLDESSVALLLKEVFTDYKGYCQGQDWQVEQSRPYRDYIAWIRQQDMSKAETFWGQALEGFTAPTPLSVKQISGSLSEGETEYAEQQLQISETVTAKLQSLAFEYQLSSNTLLQGAWAILLSRYSGEEDVVFGIKVSGRPQALQGAELMLGSFTNTQPLRVRVLPDTTVVSFLKELQNQQINVRQYEFTSPLQISQWSEISNETPLFESSVVLDNDSIDELCQQHFGSIYINNIQRWGNLNSPITVKAYWDTKLTLEIIYNRHRFDGDTVNGMLEHLQTLLSGIIAQPKQFLSTLPLLTESALQQLLVEWNDTETVYLQSKCIHQLFEAQVEQRPNAIAVVFKDKKLTYEQLNHRANQLAHHLQALGVGPEILVGICTERSLEMIVGLLGILKAGGAYVPLDPAYPIERLSFMLENAQPPVLLTQEHLLDQLPSCWAQVVCLDSDWEAIAQESEQNPINEVAAKNLAYVIYTSGSTGTPKGVLLEHQGLCNLAQAQERMFDVQPNSRVLQFASLSFDASIWEIVMALCSGASLCLGTKDSLRPGADLMRLLREQSITHATLPPTALATLPIEELPNLQTVVVAGEACSPELVAQWSKGRRFFNAYGPTESTVCATVAECTSGNTHPPIGRPIANTQVYILDRYLRPVPIGVPGELYIGGASLARGYLHLPELTKEKFIPNFFSQEEGSRLYKTGDLARYLPDGNIEYLGRRDHQAKIRGFRIELGEIEVVLARHPAVREAVVIAREDQPGHKQLVGYVVPNKEKLTSNELRQFLKPKLPEYMIPTAFVVLEAMPLTPNQKIDRRALPAPDLEGSRSVIFVAPDTPTQQLIANIIAEVLQIKQVGIHDNFFELGGHSLNATQVVSRLRETINVELSLRSLFEFPTVAQLDQCISNLGQTKLGLLAPAIESVPRDTENLPLSWAQTRLWFFEQFQGATAAYNIPLAVQITGTLDINAFEQSLREIVRRHEVLRTSYHTVNGQPVQVISHDATVTLPVVDLQELPELEQSTVVQRLATFEAQQPFDLSNSPLLRVTLLRLHPQSYVLLFSMHHIISDVWSMGIFIQELSTLYTAFRSGKPNPLPELPIQYADFAVWQQQWLREQVLETQLNYWKQQLAGVPPLLELPLTKPRPPVKTSHGRSIEFQLSLELSEKLNTISQNTGVSLFMTLLAGFATLLWRYTHQNDILIGTPIANRNRLEVESLIGFFVNTLVLRTQIQGNPSFAQLLQQVEQVTLKAYEHQDVPFDLVVEALQPERSLKHSPLFQVMFVLQNAPIGNLELPGLVLTPLEIKTVTSKFDLTLSMMETPQGLLGTWEYNTDLFDRETIARMAGHFQTMLAAIVTNPQQPVGDLPLLSDAERLQLLGEWSQTQTSYPTNKCVHTLFEEQVQRTPDAVALVFEDQQLTYSELNTDANKIAHYLQSLGVGPEVLVGLCVERSLEMVLGVLGILKAGGAYVPLDLTYPQERLAFMLQDSQVRLLLTQQHLVEMLPKHHTKVVCLDTNWSSIDQESQHNPVSRSTFDNLAYVIYTSGSTGKSKGILVNHANVVRLFQATQSWYHFNEQDVWTVFHSYAFDFSVWELWGALLYGGRLVVVPYLLSRSPEDFYKLLCTQKVTVLNQTPSAFRQLIQAEESLGTAKELSLRLVIFGGEALDFQSLKPWFQRHGDQFPLLVNMYGITETTVHVTYCPVMMKDRETALGSIIGRPVPDLQVHLLDQYQQPVPIGVPGEMYIGGAGLARGYLNRPDLTADKFIPHPFNNKPSERLYRSGDLARYLPNGDLEYLGRIDHQVKIRGFRIELGEIENILAKHQAVREAVVLARETQHGDKQLVAYITLNKQQTLTINDLRNFLLKSLPEYMVPSAFVLLEALPLTPNGKIDHRSLPAPDTARPDLEAVFVAPRTPFEKILAAIWAKVLGLDQVGIYDNFFALGGDSIRSIQVQSQAREQGLSFSIQELFQYQTIQQLVENLTTLEAGSTITQQVQPFDLICEEERLKLPEDVEDAYPLTKLQMGMLFHSEYDPQTAIYQNVSSFHVQTSFSLQHFQLALQQLTDRHPVLRTSFDLSKFSEPLQLVHKMVDVPLQVEELCYLNSSEQEQVITTWFETEKSRKFDWTKAPLWRIHIHRRSEKTFQFSLTEHHAILDGWSVASMITELFECYFSLVGKEVYPIQPPPAANFRDFVALEQEAIAKQKCQRYWIDKLSDSTVTILPRWSATKQQQTVQQVGTYDVPISADVCQGLNQLARRLGVSLKSVLLAAHLRVLSLLNGQSDVVTGLISNGRPEQTDGERVLGLFLNTLPYRLQLLGGTWIDLVQATFQAEQELLPFRRYPLAELQRALDRQCLFETAFNFVNFHVYKGVFNDKDVKVLDAKGFAITNFTLLAQFYQDPSSSDVSLQLEYQTTALCSQQIKAIGDYYVRTLTAIAKEPEERYESYVLLSVQERDQLLVEWNDTQVEYPQDQYIHQLFEAQVECTPETIAVVFEDRQLTYRELNAKANQVAHYLQLLGVGPDVLVGICVERSLHMVIGILGILKAGGAYVPLDPAYPQERLSYMLNDSQPSVLLTQSQFLNKLPYDKQVICLDTDSQVISLQSSENPVNELKSQNLIYVIYTSGSTGQPKGVALSHGSLANLLLWQLENMIANCGAKTLQFAPVSFDVSLQEIFSTWCSGSTLVLLSDEVRRDGIALLGLLTQQAVEKVFLPFIALQQLAEVVSHSEFLPTNLREIIVAGEQLQITPTIASFLNKLGNCTLQNQYGPSESHVVTALKLDGDVSSWPTFPSIGRPIANTQIYILDCYLQPVPIGVSGELHIGGVSLARGYLNRPELTEEKFIPNPFSKDPKSRLYKTGDLARYLPDGNIQFQGRIDNQVKVRGFRIELQEVEAVLSEHPQLSQALATVYGTGASEKRLVAYVVPLQEQIVIAEQLWHFLQQKLPEYMIPSAFVILDSLPLTPSGKVNRRALPTPDESRATLSQTFVAPRTPAEEVLVEMWAEILDIEKIGIYDNFFHLGGHSLLATQLISRIRQAFDLEISVRQLFQSPTVAEMVTVLSEIAGSGEVIDEIADTLQEIAELSPDQVVSLLSQEKESQNNS